MKEAERTLLKNKLVLYEKELKRFNALARHYTKLVKNTNTALES